MTEAPLLTPATIAEVADRLDTALRKLRGWSVAIPTYGRLDAALRVLRAVGTAGVLPTQGDALRRLAYALRDAEEFALICDALISPPSGSLKHDVERAATGELAGTSTGSRVAVQYQTQLWVAAAFAYAGAPIRAVRTGTRATPDYAVDDGTLTYGVEVKRPLRKFRPRKHISDASRKLVETSYHGGCVVVDVSDSMPSDGIIVAPGILSFDDVGVDELMERAEDLEAEIFDSATSYIRPGREKIFTLITTARVFAMDPAEPERALSLRRVRPAVFRRRNAQNLAYHRGTMLMTRFGAGLENMGHVEFGIRPVAGNAPR